MNFQPSQVNPQGLTALIRNLGRDCPPTQYLREFLKNSIEACQRTQNPQAKISIDYHHALHAATGVYKITFTDTGDGMSPEQMLALLNNLSSSGAETNEHQNYGVGAKISAMTRNHQGIQYESWQGGIGYKVLIRYQADKEVFGIQGYVNEHGVAIYAVPLGLEDKPAMIDAHGTRVTLLGMTGNQDTMMPPQGLTGGRETWIQQYLNSRFFKLPDAIEITARQGYHLPTEGLANNYLQVVTGYQAIANYHAELKGQTRLSNATVHWWLLPENSPLKGHSALLNQGEVFDISDPWNNRLTPYGIIVGRDRVILYIEPNEAEQNTARSHLVKRDGSPLQWWFWQTEFRENLPEEISAFIDKLLKGSAQVSHSASILKRLGALQALFLLSGYQAMDLKRRNILHPEPELALAPPVKDVTLEGQPQTANPEQPAAAKLPLVEPEPAAPAEPDINLFPIVEWTNESQSPHLASKAAEYVTTENMVLANRDFKGFKDLIQYFLNKYPGPEPIERFTVNAANEVIEQALMECVAGILSLKGQPHWGDTEIWRALTPEALTTALMQRYWLASYIDRRLGWNWLSSKF